MPPDLPLDAPIEGLIFKTLVKHDVKDNNRNNDNFQNRLAIQQSWVFHRTVLKSIYSGTWTFSGLYRCGVPVDPVLSRGDDLLVTFADASPSPPRIFVLHDRLGTMAKRIERILEATPRQIGIYPANTQYSAYQRHLDDIRIIGRVVWYSRSLCH